MAVSSFVRLMLVTGLPINLSPEGHAILSWPKTGCGMVKTWDLISASDTLLTKVHPKPFRKIAFRFAIPNTVPVTDESLKSTLMLPAESGKEANSSFITSSLVLPCKKTQEHAFFALYPLIIGNENQA